MSIDFIHVHKRWMYTHKAYKNMKFSSQLLVYILFPCSFILVPLHLQFTTTRGASCFPLCLKTHTLTCLRLSLRFVYCLFPFTQHSGPMNERNMEHMYAQLQTNRMLFCWWRQCHKKKRTKMYCVVIGRKKVPFVWVSGYFYFMDSVVRILPEFLVDLTQCLCPHGLTVKKIKHH